MQACHSRSPFGLDQVQGMLASACLDHAQPSSLPYDSLLGALLLLPETHVG